MDEMEWPYESVVQRSPFLAAPVLASAADTAFVVAHFHLIMGVRDLWILRDLLLVPQNVRAMMAEAV